MGNVAELADERRYKTLCQCPLFANLSQHEIVRLVSLSRIRHYDEGKFLFRKGDEADGFYILMNGRIEISITSLEGRKFTLNTHTAPEGIGEISLLDGQPRSADGIAREDTDLLFISRDDFLHLLHNTPAFALHMISLLCQRLRWEGEFLEAIALLNVSGRLAKRLLQLASKQQPEHGVDKPVSIKISQSELAEFLGLSRTCVNQYLQKWNEDGWITLDRNRITILEPTALSKAFNI